MHFVCTTFDSSDMTNKYNIYLDYCYFISINSFDMTNKYNIYIDYCYFISFDSFDIDIDKI